MNPFDLEYFSESLEKNNRYDEYLTTHISNVKKGYEWLKENLPELLSVYNYADEINYYGELDDIIAQHDKTKYIKIPDASKYYELTCEYNAYADYFYGIRDKEVEEKFNIAWLSHIHNNPHHWQYWILHNDTDGLQILDMPYVFIIEAICDWWSFSWNSNNLYEIFDWYDKNKKGILISDKTKTTFEYILSRIRDKLNSLCMN